MVPRMRDPTLLAPTVPGLRESLERYCTCGLSPEDERDACTSHSLLDDGMSVKRLLFARHLAARFLAEEFRIPGGTGR